MGIVVLYPVVRKIANFRLVFAIIILVFLFADHALAEKLILDLDKDGVSSTGKILQLFAIITILSLAPSILIMVTSFTRIIVVFSFLRSALGLQQTPPNQVLTSLALFLTFFIMTPTLNEAYDNGITPFMNEELDYKTAIEKTAEPFHKFMLSQAGEKELALFVELGGVEITEQRDIPYHILLPSFLISELKRAFEIGFLIFLPFLIIDIVVSSTLMAMGMMMLPPVVVSMPFKLIFFVLIDGWVTLSDSLTRSFY